MPSFTPSTAALDCLSASLIGEIVLALNERYYAVNGALAVTPANYAAGQDALKTSLWITYGLQPTLETLATSYVNDAAGTYDPHLLAPPIPLHTLATWRAAAGLSSSGFRRARAWNPAVDDWTDLGDPMWTVSGQHDGGFGQIQAGDIYGPWILDDLQKGLSALRWTTSLLHTASDVETQEASGTWQDTCALARADCDAIWAAASPFSGGNFIYYFDRAWEYSTGLTQWAFTATRIQGKASLAVNIPTGLTLDWECYIRAGRPYGGAGEGDLAGMVLNNLYFMASALDASASPLVTPRLGSGIWSFPPDVAPALSCPLSTPPNSERETICAIDEYGGTAYDSTWWLLKWHFSHS